MDRITVPAEFDTASRMKELERKLKSNPAVSELFAELAAVYSHEG